MAKFRKKPIEIEAFQLTWGAVNGIEKIPLWAKKANDEGTLQVSFTRKIENTQYADIVTLEGVMRADANDWIIQGVNGEIYPCKPDIFEKTYEPLKED